MKTHIIACASIAPFLMATPALAHHDTPAPSRSEPVQTERQSQVQMDVSTTAFDIEDHQGQFWTVGLAARLQLSKRFGVRLRLPVHSLGMEDQERATGIGDGVLGGDVEVWRRPDTRLRLGLDAHLPLGTRDDGLGHGTAALVPYAEMAHRVARDWLAFARTGASINTFKRNASTPTFVEHRADAEVRGTVGVGWRRERLWIDAPIRTVVPLAPSDSRGTAYVSAAPSAATRVTDSLWVALFGELPLHSTRQLDWHTGVAIRYVWEHRDETPTTGRSVAHKEEKSDEYLHQ